MRRTSLLRSGHFAPDFAEAFPHRRSDLERSEPGVVVMEMACDKQFFGFGLLENRPELLFHAFRRADSGVGQSLLDLGDLEIGGVFSDVVNWRRYRTWCSSPKGNKGLLEGTELAAGLRIGFGGEHIYTDHGIGLLKLPGGLEFASINVQRLDNGTRSEM